MFELLRETTFGERTVCKIGYNFREHIRQALIRDVGTKSVGDDLADIEVFNLNTSAGVTIDRAVKDWPQ